VAVPIIDLFHAVDVDECDNEGSRCLVGHARSRA
jgi:hypothetical protein